MAAAGNTFAAIAVTSTVVVAANRGRKTLIITNDSDFKVYLALGADAVVGSGIPLSPSAVISFDRVSSARSRIFVGAINAIHADSGTKSLAITELDEPT